jgi:hypothetical protein
MGRKSYENFGSLAEQVQDCTVIKEEDLFRGSLNLW